MITQFTAFDGSYRFRGSLTSGQYRAGEAPGKRADGTPFFTGYDPVFLGGASTLEGAQPILLTAPNTILAVRLSLKRWRASPPPHWQEVLYV